ncbi:28029_t:CDS:2, partial [Gigaspora margarita]
MSRLIHFLILFLAFIWSASAQVSVINTPAASVAVGATISIFWSYTPQVNPLPGTLSVIDNRTKNTVVISNTVSLASQSLLWTVNVPAGTYYLAINDGSGEKYSGTFTVIQAKAPAPVASNGPQAPSGASPPTQPQSSSNNLGIYIGVAVSGIVVGVIFSFVGYRSYKKHQDSKFIPTP